MTNFQNEKQENGGNNGASAANDIQELRNHPLSGVVSRYNALHKSTQKEVLTQHSTLNTQHYFTVTSVPFEVRRVEAMRWADTVALRAMSSGMLYEYISLS